MNPALAARLNEAADRLGEGLPDETRAIQFLEGDVGLDELDLYCVNLMRAKASGIAA